MLRGKDDTEIDFMCLTMIDPASSWFEIEELPVAAVASPPFDSTLMEVNFRRIQS
jgi:hypothetical protein